MAHGIIVSVFILIFSKFSFAEIPSPIAQALHASLCRGEFHLVDEKLNSLTKSQAKTTGGYPLDGSVVAQMGGQLFSSPICDAEELISKWKASDKISVWPFLVRSIYLSEQAWSYRGAGYTNTVKQDSWPRFNQLLENSIEECDKALAISPNNIIALTTKLSDLIPLGGFNERFKSVYAQAFQVDQYNYYVHHPMLVVLSPQWGGNENALIGYARKQTISSPRNSRLKYMIVDATGELLCPFNSKARGIYLNQPGIWDEVRQSCNNSTATFPGSYHMRVECAYLASFVPDANYSAKMYKEALRVPEKELLESEQEKMKSVYKWLSSIHISVDSPDHSPKNTASEQDLASSNSQKAPTKFKDILNLLNK